MSWNGLAAKEPAGVQFVPLSADRSIRYPVAPLLAVHATSMAVDPIAVAVTPVGVAGGATSVVAVAVPDGGESPPALVANTR